MNKNISNLKFAIGETFDYLHHTGRTKRSKTVKKKCIVVQDCQQFITVDLGNYKTTIMKSDILSGEVKLMPA